MRLWLWEFVAWAGREWNLVQDCYWWAVDAMPLGGIKRHQGLMRPSVKMCVWLGPPDCYRNQDDVLMDAVGTTSARHRSDVAFASGQVAKHIATAPSPRPLMSEVGRHRSTACPSRLAVMPAQDTCILPSRLTTWPPGGAGTFCRRKVCCWIVSLDREMSCWRGWITERRRSSASKRSGST